MDIFLRVCWTVCWIGNAVWFVMNMNSHLEVRYKLECLGDEKTKLLKTYKEIAEWFKYIIERDASLRCIKPESSLYDEKNDANGG